MTDAPTGPWRKSSYSDTGGNCVEIAQAGTTIAVRDSKDPADRHLTFSPHAWTAFTRRIKHGK
ncbi:MAG: DUF397 domain-containing protein [Streptosporangiaceae bacterium]|nr:DUF397 domain-containing protein [Streptosporangiaceae bacterium]